ncbi:pseudaminic acid cytidylyltransferase [Agaribacter marinus]|uniref:Pseudaminic acid cytidylyltransferase n=1 Tax=Agaribacter marinus TaxID=1431249 RepID=A0AA37SVZ2_9ALTE|nr:pseudaminic acid cytidylyltransferase [Agaribacter marinus]GLR70776.1 pseudaminic acid cytidylyltransferase [Agaribacter marinus]
MSIAIIPARGGSKRIPKKNIKDFNGKPLIAYSLAAAKASRAFTRVFVSTDDDAIANTAMQYGADDILRRSNSTLADDYATTGDVMQDALQQLTVREDTKDLLSLVCCLYATAPLLQAAYLSRAASMFKEMKAADASLAYIFSATGFAFPVQRGFTINDGKLSMLFPECMQTRSQDLSEVFHDAGQFYFAGGNTWLAKAPVFTERSVPMNLPRYLVQDIDTSEDWIQAEFLHKALMSSMPAHSENAG